MASDKTITQENRESKIKSKNVKKFEVKKHQTAAIEIGEELQIAKN
jgi:hypothetical protein